MLMGVLLPLSAGGGRDKSAGAEERGRETVFNLYLCRGHTEGALFGQPSTSHSYTYLDLGAAPSLLLLLAAPPPEGISVLVRGKEVH